MTTERYVDMVRKQFPKWLRASFGRKLAGPGVLIQDHERCLWSGSSQRAIAGAGLRLKSDFPESSPDLNAIEGVWKISRDALIKNAPSHLEPRSEFVAAFGAHWPRSIATRVLSWQPAVQTRRQEHKL